MIAIVILSATVIATATRMNTNMNKLSKLPNLTNVYYFYFCNQSIKLYKQMIIYVIIK